MISPAQSRTARALLGWSQTNLVEASKVSIATIKAFESEARTLTAPNLAAIRQALEEAGIEFISRGVRFRVEAEQPSASMMPSDRIAELEAQLADARQRQLTAENALAADRRLYANDPNDRLFHAADASWWRRDKDGRLVRAEPPPV